MSDLGEVVQDIEKEIIIKENRIFSVVRNFYMLLSYINVITLFYFIFSDKTIQTVICIVILSVCLIFIPLLEAITEELMISHYLKKNNEGK